MMPKATIMKTIFTITNILLAGLCMSQTNYFVSTTGSDSDPGTMAQPWATLQHAAYNVGPGDVVNVRVGTYNEKFEIFASGTSLSPITFKNYNGENVIIDGTGITSLEAIVGMWGANHITIDGFKIRNSVMLDAIGIVAEGQSEGIRIINNEISNIYFSADPSDPVTAATNAQPIIIRDTAALNGYNDIVIENNIVRDCRPGFSEALTLTGNIEGFLIKDNEVYNITNIGIDVVGHYGTASANDQVRDGVITGNKVYNCKSPYALAAGIYIDGAKDLLVERNEVYNCQWGIEIGCEVVGESAEGNWVINNLIYNNDDAGLVLGGYDYPTNSGKVTDCLLRNNTYYSNDQNAGGIGGSTSDIFLTYTENCIIENNIFYITNASGQALYDDNVGSINLELNYNDYYRTGGASVAFEYGGVPYSDLSGYQAGSSQDPNSLGADPMLVDVSSADFRLIIGSPMIEGGNPSAFLIPGEMDFAGNSRLQSTIVDIGAYEGGVAAPISQEYLVDLSCIELIHEPDTDQIFISGNFAGKTMYIVNAANMVVQSLNGMPSPIAFDVTTLPAGKHFLIIRDTSNPDLHFEDMIKE